MQTEKIFLHVVLNPAEQMEPISALFYTSNHQEIVPWFPADTTMYRFHLAGTASTEAPAEESFSVIRTTPTSLPTTPNFEPPPFFRNYTFPMDATETVQVPLVEGSSPEPPAEFTKPSLVTRLQKIHGLTRKKKYGAQPTVQPFLREDRAPTPTPLSVQTLASPPVSPIAESRLPAKAKADRARRLSSKGPLATGHPEPVTRPERRGSWFRRKPKPPVPDRSSSPTSGSSHSPRSPPIPTPAESDARYGGASTYTPWESPWPNPPVYHSDAAFPSHGHGPAASQPYFASSSASTSYRSSTSPPMPTEAISSPASPFVSDLDKPFILSPEYEAAATARFHAIFNTPSGSDVPDFTSMNTSAYNPHPEMQYTHSGLPPPPPPQQPYPYYSLNLRQPAAYEYSVDPQVTFSPQEPLSDSFGAVGTSSLEGWNGQFPM
ncbi:hypothetical protein HWV62_12650 [Athelia sp. TMB]|nr:hypothetical protein HWV62_12650 [Athelia sp. TMB]